MKSFFVLTVSLFFYQAAADQAIHIENIVGVYVCSDGPVLLEDAWEADNASHFPIAYDAAPANIQIDKMINMITAIHPRLAESLANYNKQLQENLVPIPDNGRISAPALTSKVEMNCERRGLLSYDSDHNVLSVDNVLMGRLGSETAKALAYLHILLAREMQKDNELKSIAFVKLVNGCLFSADAMKCLDITPMERPIKFPQGAPIWRCTSADSQNVFYSYPDSDKYSSTINFVIDKVSGIEIAAKNSGGVQQYSSLKEFMKDVIGWKMMISSSEFHAYDSLKEYSIQITSGGKLRAVGGGAFIGYLADLSFAKYPRELTDTGPNKFSCELVSGSVPPFVRQIPKLRTGRYIQLSSDNGYVDCDARYLGFNSATEEIAIEWVQADLKGIISAVKCDRIGRKLSFKQQSSYQKGQSTVWESAAGQGRDSHILTIYGDRKNTIKIDNFDYSIL